MKSLSIISTIILLIALALVGFWYFNWGSGDSTQVENTYANDELVLKYYTYGGLCNYGACNGTVEIFGDGRVESKDGSGQKTSKQLSEEELNRLLIEISRTDFEIVLNSEFDGVCPVAYDGQEAQMTINTGKSEVFISSCKQDFTTINSNLEQVLYDVAFEG